MIGQRRLTARDHWRNTFGAGLKLVLAATTAICCMAWPARAAEKGVSPNEILLGQTGAASGGLARLNEEYLGGAKLYFAALNQRGGANGRRIRLIELDDGYNPEKAVANATRLIEQDKVFALFACFGTGPSLKVLPIANRLGVPYFAPYTGADALRSNDFEWAFHVRASYGQEVRKIVEHLTALGVTAIAVVHHDDPFGRAGLEVAQAALQAKGLEPILSAPIESNGTNADAVVRRVVEANPAAVVMITAGASSVALIKGIMETDLRPHIYGLSVISSNELIDRLGKMAHGLVVSQVVPSPYGYQAPVVNEYRDAATAAGKVPSYTALEGYIAAKTFAEALKRSGAEPTRATLASALRGMSDYDPGGFALHYGPKRSHGSDYVDLSVVSHGRFTH